MVGMTAVLVCVLALCGDGLPVAPLIGPELPTSVVRLSMQHADGQILVPVRIDGQGPFLFRIDTGTSVPLALDAKLARQLGLQAAPADDGAEDVADDASDASATAVVVERLELGAATFVGLQAVTLAEATPGAPGSHAQGVLGFPFFRDVLLTIDYASGVVELQRGALSSEAEGVLPLVGTSGTPQVPMQVGHHVYLTRIDTGFADNVALPLAAADEVGTEGAPAAVGRVHADGASREARSARLTDSLLVAGRRYDRLPVLFAELPAGARIGYGLLAYFKLTFDQGSGLVRITASPVQPAAPAAG